MQKYSPRYFEISGSWTKELTNKFWWPVLIHLYAQVIFFFIQVPAYINAEKIWNLMRSFFFYFFSALTLFRQKKIKDRIFNSLAPFESSFTIRPVYSAEILLTFTTLEKEKSSHWPLNIPSIYFLVKRLPCKHSKHREHALWKSMKVFSLPH